MDLSCAHELVYSGAGRRAAHRDNWARDVSILEFLGKRGCSGALEVRLVLSILLALGVVSIARVAVHASEGQQLRLVELLRERHACVWMLLHVHPRPSRN